MNISWKSLPQDVVHLILKFDGRIVYRTEQYLNRIPPADPRYDMLLYRLPRKHLSYSFTQVNLDRNNIRTMVAVCNTNRCRQVQLYTKTDGLRPEKVVFHDTVEYIYSYVDATTNNMERIHYHLH